MGWLGMGLWVLWREIGFKKGSFTYGGPRWGAGCIHLYVYDVIYLKLFSNSYIRNYLCLYVASKQNDTQLLVFFFCALIGGGLTIEICKLCPMNKEICITDSKCHVSLIIYSPFPL